MNQPPPNPNSGEFDIRSLESHDQRILREEFEALEARNRQFLEEFDPYEEDAWVGIDLVTDFEVAEDAEPLAADAKRRNMLQNLGLEYKVLAQDDPDNIFYYESRDGVIEQIRLIERADGTQIPVYTVDVRNSSGESPEYRCLLAHNEASQLKQQLEYKVEMDAVRRRADWEFDLDEEFLETTNLTDEDLKAMFAQYDEILGYETTSLDHSELDTLRSKIARAMFPGAAFLSRSREPKLPRLIEAYEQKLLRVLERYGFDDKAGFLEGERELRLSALNEQLKARRKVMILGMAATGSRITLTDAGLGAAGGFFFGGGTAAGTIIGTVVGAGMGLWRGTDQGLEYRGVTRGVEDIDADYFGPPKSVSDQLLQEQDIAKDYINRLNSHRRRSK